MKRTWPSGFQKRKIAAEKKAKQSAALQGVPKINTLFGAISSTSSSTSNPENSDFAVDERGECSTASKQKDDCEATAICVDVDDGEREETNESESDVDVPTDVDAEEFCDEVTEFHTDAALWDIPNDTLSLQKYWIVKGSYDVLNKIIEIQ